MAAPATQPVPPTKPKSPSSEYQKGLGAPFSVGETREMEVREEESLTLEDAERRES